MYDLYQASSPFSRVLAFPQSSYLIPFSSLLTPNSSHLPENPETTNPIHTQIIPLFKQYVQLWERTKE